MTSKPIKFAAIGECMIELRHANAHNLDMGMGGDTFNVALYLARYRDALSLSVDYVTALGDDPYSSMMLESWQQEGIGTQWVQCLKDMLPGLYLIRTDERGERKFYYYRSQSAARKMFYGPKIKAITKKLERYQHLYTSGIPLAVLDTKSRKQLLELLRKAKKNGASISFDTNYRPILWENKATAKKVMTAALKLADRALVTFDDEQKLFGDKTPEQCAKRLHKFGVKEVVIKLGEKGCFISAAGQQQYVPAEKVTNVVDTTAAGDSFNAAYLAGRMTGLNCIDAGRLGHRLAAKVVQFKGAIIPKKEMPVLF